VAQAIHQALLLDELLFQVADLLPHQLDGGKHVFAHSCSPARWAWAARSPRARSNGGAISDAKGALNST
jgi:hypothetical protein